jgi:hypothetical protein
VPGGGDPPEGVTPETVLWRRIPPRHFPKEGETLPNSSAFDDDEDGSMSVVIASSGRSPLDILEGHEGFGLVRLTVSDLEYADQRLVPDPLLEEADHALVVGEKSKARKRRMKKACIWIVDPSGRITL